MRFSMPCPAHILALLILGCSKDASVPTPPTYEVDYVAGFCGHSVILDATGRLWFESGCEGNSSGTNPVRFATPDEVSRVATAFSQLPIMSNLPCTFAQPDASRVGALRTIRRRFVDHDVLWGICQGDPPNAVASCKSAYASLDDLVPHETEVDASTE
jgi:hypothetical protein